MLQHESLIPPGGDTLLDRLDHHVHETPELLALKFLREGEAAETLTYSQLMQRVRVVAARLQGLVEPGDRALLLYPQGLEFMVAFLGCLRAGVIAVPAYPPRQNRKSERLHGIIADCAPAIVLTDVESHRLLTPEIVASSGGKILTTDDASGEETEFTPSRITPETVAWLQYTSGSTSAPKGVVLTHGAVVANIRQIAAAVEMWSGWVVVSWLPMYHDMGLVGSVLSPLYLGGRSILMSPAAFLRKPFLWLKAFTDERGTFAACPNFGFDLCIKSITEDEKRQLNLSSIRLIVNGAETVRAETLDRFHEAFGACGWQPQMMLPCFGLAEATLLVTGGTYGQAPRRVRIDAESSEPTTVAQSRSDSETLASGVASAPRSSVSDDVTGGLTPPRSPAQFGRSRWAVSCGAAAVSSRVVVVDSQTRRPQPEGKIGEVWVQSPSLGSGYWGQAELSRETFENWLAEEDAGPGADAQSQLLQASDDISRNALASGSRKPWASAQRLIDGGDESLGPFLNTGDLGFLLDGELYVTGRSKDLIIIRGRNIYPQDVERAVERVLPFVEANSCAAFSVVGSDSLIPHAAMSEMVSGEPCAVRPRVSCGDQEPAALRHAARLGLNSSGVRLNNDGTEKLAVVIEANRELVRTARAAEKDVAARQQLDALVAAVREAIGEEFEIAVDAIAFLRPATFPRTSSGKVQRRACRELLQHGSEDFIHVCQSGTTLRVVNRDAERRATLTAADDSRTKADAIIAWLRDYAGRRLNSRVMDERRTIAPYVVLDFGNHGLFGLQVPTEYGGLGLSTMDTLRIIEQLAAIDLTLASMVGIHNGLGVRPILNFGSEALRQELLPQLATGRQLAAFALTEPGAGSNPIAMQATARKTANGWRVHAEKQWIGLASWAGVITVFAKAQDANGMSAGTVALAVRENTVGLRHGPEALTMGIRGMVQNSVILDNALLAEGTLLGQVGDGMKVAQDAMMSCRLGLAAMSIGGMKRCAQLMTRYAERREVASGRLLDNPVTLARLHELTCAIAATEALVSQIAAWLDAGEEVPVEAYVACKTSGPELLGQAVDHAMQLLGGRGYVETNVLPQMLRDARVLRIFEGPTETLNAFLGANVLQRPQGIAQLLADKFGSPEIARELLANCEQLGSRTRESSDSRDELGSLTTSATKAETRMPGMSPRLWAGFQAGELATAAILWAAATNRHRDDHAHPAIAWARERFARLRDAALAPTGQHAAALLAQPIADCVGDYAQSIGDIEQTLPGEDGGLDAWLRKSDDHASVSRAVKRDGGFGLKGQDSIAQGNALGTVSPQLPSPERARQLDENVSPLQGFDSISTVDPGRCPGLSNSDPSGLKPGNVGVPSLSGTDFVSGTALAAGGVPSVSNEEPAASAVPLKLSQLLHDKIVGWLRSELDQSVDSIGEDVSFIALGIDSVGAVEIALAIEQATGLKLSPETIYEYRTLRELTAYLETQRGIGPTGQDSKAQGNALGSGSSKTVSPEGAKQIRDNVSPLQDFDDVASVDPGRCPGLSSDVPSGLKAGKIQSGDESPQSKGVQSGADTPHSKTSRRGAAFVQQLMARDRTAQALKARGLYFYDTPFSQIDGNSGTALDEAGDERRMIMLSSFSYLGLIGHPEVNQASSDTIRDFGTGAHGVRLLAGNTTRHRELERSLAGFMQAEAAIVYGTGYVTNLASISAIVGREGYVIGDEFNHASIADGCSFAGGEFVTFRHNDLRSLEQRLQAANGRHTLVVVDGVYSMEGDIAPVPDIVRLCDQYDALLMVDEAHSLGVIGATGRGVQEHFHLPPDAIDLKMGTLSKALGSQGGFVAARAEIVSFLKHNSRGFVFSTATPAPTIAATLKGLEILQREPQRVTRLQHLAARFLSGVRELGFQTTATQTPIIPLLCGTEEKTLQMTAECRRRGLFVVPIFYPVVPMNSPRIRITLIATLTDEDIERSLKILGEVGREVGVLR